MHRTGIGGFRQWGCQPHYHVKTGKRLRAAQNPVYCLPLVKYTYTLIDQCFPNFSKNISWWTLCTYFDISQLYKIKEYFSTSIFQEALSDAQWYKWFRPICQKLSIWIDSRGVLNLAKLVNPFSMSEDLSTSILSARVYLSWLSMCNFGCDLNFSNCLLVWSDSRIIEKHASRHGYCRHIS